MGNNGIQNNISNLIIRKTIHDTRIQNKIYTIKQFLFVYFLFIHLIYLKSLIFYIILKAKESWENHLI